MCTAQHHPPLHTTYVHLLILGALTYLLLDDDTASLLRHHHVHHQAGTQDGPELLGRNTAQVDRLHLTILSLSSLRVCVPTNWYMDILYGKRVWA